MYLYTLRLAAGPLVVSIKQALCRRYKSRNEAEDAFAAATQDGIVMKLTLVEKEMDSRFLELS